MTTMIEDNSYNIPTVSVSTATEMLSAYFIKALMTNHKPFTAFLWGAPGIGKSFAVSDIAEKLSAATDKPVFVTSLPLSLYTPSDLLGIPSADNDKTYTKWLMPAFLRQMNPSSEVINILFLDELSSVPPSMQTAAYRIVLDRVVGEHPLPDNCIIIAAGNRVTDKSVAYIMSKALSNRMLHIGISHSFKSWKEWGIKNNIHPYVIDFLSFDSSRLFRTPDSKDLAYPTPRTWEMVSHLLYTLGTDFEYITEFVASAVGFGLAAEFIAWCKANSRIPDIRRIARGAQCPYPDSNDVLYAVIKAMLNMIQTENVSEAVIENMARYATKFPPDFMAMFFTDLCELEKVKAKLIKCPTVREWTRENKLLP